jgi:hypothetical protein
MRPDENRREIAPRRQRPRSRIAGLLVVIALAATGCSSTDSDSASNSGDDASSPPELTSLATADDVGLRTQRTSDDGQLTLETTSSRAWMVSGDDVLVTVSGPAADEATITVDGTDVTDRFATLDGPDPVRRGLVSGLAIGDNALKASSGESAVELTVVNHRLGGPIFSGPHLEPWVCETQDVGLGAARDADCTVDPVTTWSYATNDGAIVPLEAGDSVPADAATVDVGGTTWPVVIRTERGVINRGIYTIWTLDPGAIDFPAELLDAGNAPTWQAGAFNGRLVYRFGGGCGTQFNQGASFGALGGGPDLGLLKQGYAVATNTLNTFQTACNQVLSAETMMMTREHFVKSYAVPEFTIGDGGSGGAIQQLAIASSYPGALDGISASLPFPDALTLAPGVTDCGLLLGYYATPDGSSLDESQRRAISGHATSTTCESWANLFLAAVDPTVGCGPQLTDQVYDAATNPTGVRCTLQDINVNALGRDPSTGFASRPLDNVGVQYGLAALNDGAITMDQFLDLNDNVGSYDLDGAIVAGRSAASEESLARLYAAGAIANNDSLRDVPIILRNVYLDPIGDIHSRVWAFSVRERLRRNGVDSDNLLLWTNPGTGGIGALVGSITGEIEGATASVELIDQWLTTGSRPAQATNVCVLPDGTRLAGGWELYDAPGPCVDAYPVASDPRFVAGQDLKGDVLACTRKPIDDADYPVAPTADQRQRLADIFTQGVCDWTQPGIGQQPAAGTWLTFG